MMDTGGRGRLRISNPSPSNSPPAPFIVYILPPPLRLLLLLLVHSTILARQRTAHPQNDCTLASVMRSLGKSSIFYFAHIFFLLLPHYFSIFHYPRQQATSLKGLRTRHHHYLPFLDLGEVLFSYIKKCVILHPNNNSLECPMV